MAARPATEASLSAGIGSRNHEAVLLALTTRRGQVLTGPQIAGRAQLHATSVPGMLRQLELQTLVAQVGKVSKSYTWVATADGYALADLIREEPGQPTADQGLSPVSLPSGPPVPAVAVAAHPATGGRVEREEAIWRWIRSATRAGLAGASHRFIDALDQAIAEEGEHQ